jgi:hypothetical protein
MIVRIKTPEKNADVDAHYARVLDDVLAEGFGRPYYQVSNEKLALVRRLIENDSAPGKNAALRFLNKLPALVAEEVAAHNQKKQKREQVRLEKEAALEHARHTRQVAKAQNNEIRRQHHQQQRQQAQQAREQEFLELFPNETLPNLEGHEMPSLKYLNHLTSFRRNLRPFYSLERAKNTFAKYKANLLKIRRAQRSKKAKYHAFAVTEPRANLQHLTQRELPPNWDMERVLGVPAALKTNAPVNTRVLYNAALAHIKRGEMKKAIEINNYIKKTEALRLKKKNAPPPPPPLPPPPPPPQPRRNKWWLAFLALLAVGLVVYLIVFFTVGR